MPDALPDDRRRVIFADLVNAQDEGLSVPASRDRVAERYGVTPEDVREIEREGLAAGWPPLGE